MKFNIETIKIEKVVEVEERAFVLTLNKEEAEALLCVCRRIGGSLVTPPRMLASNIINTFQEFGLRDPNYKTEQSGGSLIFTGKQ
jgi:hypothetical protein